MARQLLRATVLQLKQLVADLQAQVTANWGSVPKVTMSNLHYLTHIPNQLRLNRPVYQHWTFPGKAQRTNLKTGCKVTT